MTVSTTSNRIQYAGLTGQDTFAYNFRVDVKEDMTVYFDGVAQSDDDWTITDLGDAAGGDVILDTPLASNTTITLMREVALTQSVDYVANDSFPSETHEGALDRQTFFAQQLQEQIDRNLSLSVDDPDKLLLGDSGDADAFVISRDGDIGLLTLKGSDVSGDGGNIDLYGISHASQPGDVIMGSGIWGFLFWDESTGHFKIQTGIGGPKTLVLEIDDDQLATFTQGDASNHRAINLATTYTGSDQGRSAITENSKDVGPSALVVKQSDEVVNNSTTLQDDNELKFYAEANTCYEVEVFIRAFNINSIDLKFSFTDSVGTNYWTGLFHSGQTGTGFASSVEGIQQDAGEPQVMGISSSATNLMKLHISYQNGATAQDVFFRWAQNVLNASDLTVLKGSYLKAHRIGSYTP